MPKWITFAFALFLCLQVFSTKAQDVDDVIDKHVAAMGSKGSVKLRETAHTNGCNSENDCASLLVNYKSMGHKAELLGKENVNGRACYQIKLVLQSGSCILYDIDAVTWFIIRATGLKSKGTVRKAGAAH